MSVSPGAEVPVLLAGVRDEFVDRPWLPPRAHWPARPDLLGGLDQRGGGTWLAVDARTPRVAAVLNAGGWSAPEDGRRTRGELPLRAAELGDLDFPERELRRFEPFHLVLATPAALRLWTWDGRRVASRDIATGAHMVTRAGIDSVPDEPRVAHFLPRFQGSARPVPAKGQSCGAAWGEWLALIDGGGLDPADDRAIVVRNRVEGRVWGSSSATLVALRAAGVRYDFSSKPGDSTAWGTVLDRHVGPLPGQDLPAEGHTIDVNTGG